MKVGYKGGREDLAWHYFNSTAVNPGVVQQPWVRTQVAREKWITRSHMLPVVAGHGSKVQEALQLEYRMSILLSCWGTRATHWHSVDFQSVTIRKDREDSANELTWMIFTCRNRKWVVVKTLNGWIFRGCGNGCQPPGIGSPPTNNIGNTTICSIHRSRHQSGRACTLRGWVDLTCKPCQPATNASLLFSIAHFVIFHSPASASFLLVQAALAGRRLMARF